MPTAVFQYQYDFYTLQHRLRVKLHKQHVYRWTLHNTVCTTFLLTLKTDQEAKKWSNAQFSHSAYKGGIHTGLRTLGCWDSSNFPTLNSDFRGRFWWRSWLWGLMERTLILHPTKQACFKSVLLYCADLGPTFLNCNRAFGTKRKKKRKKQPVLRIFHDCNLSTQTTAHERTPSMLMHNSQNTHSRVHTQKKD